jgi:hypothetical protein
MADAASTGHLQQIQVADNIRFRIGVRVLKRISHAGLGAQVDNHVELDSLERGLQSAHAGEIDFHEIEAGPDLAAYLLSTGPLKRDGVIAVEIVETYNFVIAREQPTSDGSSDETRRSRDKTLHRRFPRRHAFSCGMMRIPGLI